MPSLIRALIRSNQLIAGEILDWSPTSLGAFMLSLHDQPLPPWEGQNRREWFLVGGLSLAGLSLPQLLKADQDPRGADTFGRAKNVIFLWLQGGPPQHETFDPKPDAPAEIRGPFEPIQTTVPGIRFCELLPRTARIAHKLAVVRSLHPTTTTTTSAVTGC